MKNIFILVITALLFTISGCKKFIDVNDNPNVPTDVNEALILSPVELDRALNKEFAAATSERLTAIGFKYVTLDLKGFRSGSMN